MPTYHENHVCSNCGDKYGRHAGRGNPYVPESTCPSGPFPKWPTTIADEREAGKLFDQRVERFWKASGTTFKPRV